MSGAQAVTPEACNAAIGAALRARFGAFRSPPKLVARLADATERAAQNWLSSICGPQTPKLILLMAREPLVALAVQQLVEDQRALDAELAARLARRGAPDGASGRGAPDGASGRGAPGGPDER